MRIEAIVAELLATTDRTRARAVQWRISQWKNALVSPATALGAAQSEDEAAAARIYERYDSTLRSYQAVDFDDLIMLPAEALERDATVAARWRNRFRYLLVDEYQDTNPAQYRLLKMLVGERAALLRSANALIANNTKLYAKRLWSDLGLGEPIQVTPAADDLAEAEAVVRRLLARKFECRRGYADFAILYRGKHQSRAFEQALRAQNVPYVVSGGQSWFERIEIKDLVAYLRVIINDDDDPAFIRAVTTPRRGVGANTLAKLGSRATAVRQSLFATVYDAALQAELNERQHLPLANFCALINQWRLRAEGEPAGRLLDDLIVAIGYEDYLFSTLDKSQARSRWDSVRDFVGWLGKKGETDGKNLLELTQTIALMTLLEGQERREADAVRLSTLHAAKGLEFPHVFLVGLEEGILPHREAVAAGNVDEERRLMYVGLTRAQQTLDLSWCRRRKRAGEWHAGERSRFVGELAQEDLRHADQALGAEEAAQEKNAGNARLKNLRAMLGS